MRFSLLFIFLLLSSCQWVATHPKEDILVIEAAEKGLEELYKYETRTLSPGIQHPSGIPPMR